jgi:2-polyprenyl-3-methyl-5-hydroxy-6-metoxy-1,4-benzoquinol methylase
MESKNCIICGSDKKEPYLQATDRFGGEAFKIVKCECDFTYLSPRPSLNEIYAYYENDKYEPHQSQKKSYFDNVYGWVQGKALKWKYKLITRFVPSGNLLDIGGGSGSFCTYFQSKGWTVSLQDSSVKACNIARKNNISTHESLLDISNQKFNLITMWHSLEHIHDIELLFSNIHNLAAKDGILVIAVPNINAPERKFFKDNWAPWDAPRHLYHFSYSQLGKLLIKHGWEIEQTKSMLQDTPYNILLSLKSNSPLQLIIGGFILLYSLIKAVIGGVNSSSSFMVICKRI